MMVRRQYVMLFYPKCFKVTVHVPLRAQLRDAPASDLQFRLDHERRLRAAAEEQEAVVSFPQVQQRQPVTH